MDYKIIKCDGCGEFFNENDDIVTCPVCGTPRHRDCFEKNGGCVNSEKHESGFEWEMPTAAKKMMDIEKKEGQSRKKSDPVRERLDMGELPFVDDVIEQRIKAICPGITEEQKKERLCGAGIAQTAAFIGNGAETYVKKFRKKETTGKSTFNWAAFLFMPYWFFWRKMYKPGIIFGTINLCFELMLSFFVNANSDLIEQIRSMSLENIGSLQSEQVIRIAAISFAFEIMMLVLHLISGFVGDKLYWRYCKKTLADFAVKKQMLDDERSLKFYLSKSSTSALWAIVSMAVTYFVPQIIMFFTLN